MANDRDLPDDLSQLARDLVEAYSSPISTHIVGTDLQLEARFVGNSMFEGNDYRAFLEAALEAK